MAFYTFLAEGTLISTLLVLPHQQSIDINLQPLINLGFHYTHIIKIIYHRLSLNREGRWCTTDDFATSFAPFFPVLHCPLWLGELKACPFPDFVFPPLPQPRTNEAAPIHRDTARAEHVNTSSSFGHAVISLVAPLFCRVWHINMCLWRPLLSSTSSS